MTIKTAPINTGYTFQCPLDKRIKANQAKMIGRRLAKTQKMSILGKSWLVTNLNIINNMLKHTMI